MSKIQREIDMILSHLTKSNAITVTEAVRLLDISESTARRLFNAIADEGLAVRVRGGLRSPANDNGEYTYETHQTLYSNEKRSLAAAAARLIENNDSVFIDWGTTAYCLSEALVRRLKANEIHNITVFTNAMTNVNLLCPYCEIITLGGRYRDERKKFDGYLTEETLKLLHFKKCFVCADGFYPSMGFTTYDFESARTDELVIRNSSKSYMLMDSSKYLHAATANCTGDNQLDALITDAAPPAEMADAIRQFVRGIIVNPPAGH